MEAASAGDDTMSCPPDAVRAAMRAGEAVEPRWEAHRASCPRCRAEESAGTEVDRFEERARQALAATEPRSLLAREEFPGYEILDEISRGGQAIVYRVQQRSFDPPVERALKVLHPGALNSPARRRRFELEIDIISQMDHPSIVRVVDRGRSTSGRDYLVMEYVRGQRLDRFCLERAAEKGYDPAGTLSLLVRICEAVAYAHQRGVVHRDLKPANILVNQRSVPLILDFGIAKVRQQDVELTATGERPGTLGYSAPERGSDVDLRADVYSLGVILYQLITSRLPYPTDSFQSYFEALRRGPPATPRQVLRDVTGPTALPWSSDLEAICLCAMEPDPGNRYPSVSALMADLEALRDGRPIQIRASHAWYTVRRTLARYRLAIGVLLGITAIAVGAALFSLHFLSLLDSRNTALARKSQEVQEASLALERELEARRSVLSVVGRSLQLLAPDGRSFDREKLLEDLDWTTDQISGFALPAGVKGELLVRLGETYRQYGKAERASGILQQALALLEEGGDDSSVALFEGRRSMSLLLADRGEFGAAGRVLGECLRHAERIGLDPMKVLRIRYELGQFQIMQRDNAGATQALEALLPEAEALGERARDLVASIRADLLTCRAFAHPRPENLPELQGAVARLREVLGPEHIFYLSSLADLGDIQRRVGQFTAARECLDESVRGFQAKLGPGHRIVLTAMANRALVEISARDWAQGEERYREVLEAAERGPPEARVLVPGTLYNLSVTLMGQGEQEEAERLLWDAEAGAREQGDHEVLHRCQMNLVEIMGNQRRFDEARDLAEEAREQSLVNRGEDSAEYAATGMVLVRILARREEWDAALALLDQTLEMEVMQQNPAELAQARSLREFLRAGRDGVR